MHGQLTGSARDDGSNGTAGDKCTAGESCTAGDSCKAGVCTAGKAMSCNNNYPCAVEVRNTYSGVGVYQNLANSDPTPACSVNTDCNDNNACTTHVCTPLQQQLLACEFVGLRAVAPLESAAAKTPPTGRRQVPHSIDTPGAGAHSTRQVGQRAARGETTMNHALQLGAGLSLALTFAACGASSGASGGNSGSSGDATSSSDAVGDSGGGTGGSVSIEEFPKAVADAMCAAITKCPDMQAALPLATMQGCQSMYTSVLGSIAPILADVQAGKTKFDPAAAGNCIAMLKGDCAAVKANAKADVGACKTVFVGLSADGKDCGRDEHCANGWCSKLNPACSAGVCKAPLAAGTNCADADRCAGELVCLDQKCQANTPAKAGESCDGGHTCADGTFCKWGADKPVCTSNLPAGSPCSSSGDCQPPALCLEDSTGKTVCSMPAAEGATCKPAASPSESGCAAGLVCISDSIMKPGKCQKKVSIGGACTTSVQCGAWDLGCVGTGSKMCGALPAKGEACQLGDMMKGEYFSCLLPYSCVDGKCIDPPKLGEKCGNGIFRCASDLDCDDQTGTCKGKPGLGESCTGECGPDLTCGKDGGKNVCVAATCK